MFQIRTNIFHAWYFIRYKLSCDVNLSDLKLFFIIRCASTSLSYRLFFVGNFYETCFVGIALQINHSDKS